MADLHAEKILILDFGSQYTQLIARRVRELHVYCEIHPCTMPLEQIRAFAPRGIILSGSPFSVEQPGAPLVDRAVQLRDAMDGFLRQDIGEIASAEVSWQTLQSIVGSPPMSTSTARRTESVIGSSR